MMHLSTKIFGWILLITGILIIGWTLVSSYNTFTGKAEIIEILKMETEEVEISTKEKTPTSQAELQKEMERMIGEQLKELLPVDTLPKLLNLAAWAMLAWVLIFGGAQISNLGIKLLKK